MVDTMLWGLPSPSSDSKVEAAMSEQVTSSQLSGLGDAWIFCSRKSEII
jgi:hypothetical protein